MAVRISRSSRFVFFVLWLLLYVGGSPIAVFGQDGDRKGAIPSEGKNTNRPYRRDDLTSNWNQRGRIVPGQSAAGLRLRAYRRKMAMRAERAAATASTSSSPSLIWCDPVNIFESLVWVSYLSFRGQGQQQPWQVMATIDQADIRGSEPHNHDPSGAASD
jgi:hypothetical protein